VPPPRPNAGQASAEYVALLAVVCVVVAGAAAVGSVPPLARDVVAAVKHGICRVAGGVCTSAQARAAGLPPCLVAARTQRERLAVRVWVVRLGRDDSLLVQRRSDGSASVSFADGHAAGLSAGLGLQFAGRGATVRGSAGLQFRSGRTWEFGSFAEAASFATRWKRSESLRGEVLGVLPGGSHPPAPDATYVEGGAYAEVAAALGGPVAGEARAQLGAVAGRRYERDGRVVYSDRIDAETAGQLGLLLATVERHDAGEAALEITVEHGRPTELRLRAAARMHGDAAPVSPTTSLTDLASLIRGDAPRPRGHGRRLEAEVALDLRDPANRAALKGFVEIAALRAQPSEWDDRVRALAQRIDAAAAVELRVYRVGLEDKGFVGEAALLAGAGYDRTAEARDLLQAWSLPPGGTLQEREDCVPA
jgi:prepilin-type processing-associated H-X9-DG protein